VLNINAHYTKNKVWCNSKAYPVRRPVGVQQGAAETIILRAF